MRLVLTGAVLGTAGVLMAAGIAVPAAFADRTATVAASTDPVAVAPTPLPTITIPAPASALPTSALPTSALSTSALSTSVPTTSTATTVPPAAWTSAAPQTALRVSGSSKRTLVGVTMHGAPYDMRPLTSLERKIGHRVGLVMYYQDWAGNPNFDRTPANAIIARGAQVELTWAPTDGRRGVKQPAYRLASIIDGSHDAYIARWAGQIKAWGKPIRLRFAFEMNGDWNSWSEGVNGNKRGEYVRAWRHTHDVFARAGVRNVTWVWSPNVEFPHSTALRGLYPGKKYVDAVGVDGYNWGPLNKYSTWQSFGSVFSRTLTKVKKIAPGKPLYLSEVGCTERGGNKAKWVTSFLKAVAKRHDIRGFTWFNYDKETDWRMQSSKKALASFRKGLNAKRFR